MLNWAYPVEILVWACSALVNWTIPTQFDAQRLAKPSHHAGPINMCTVERDPQQWALNRVTFLTYSPDDFPPHTHASTEEQPGHSQHGPTEEVKVHNQGNEQQGKHLAKTNKTAPPIQSVVTNCCI